MTDFSTWQSRLAGSVEDASVIEHKETNKTTYEVIREMKKNCLILAIRDANITQSLGSIQYEAQATTILTNFMTRLIGVRWMRRIEDCDFEEDSYIKVLKDLANDIGLNHDDIN